MPFKIKSFRLYTKQLFHFAQIHSNTQVQCADTGIDHFAHAIFFSYRVGVSEIGEEFPAFE